jgi:hypothetical protein
LDALKILKPQTVIRWLTALVCKLTGAGNHDCAGLAPFVSSFAKSRIHGELLKLGIDVAQTTVAKYMARRRSQQKGLPALRRCFGRIVDLLLKPSVNQP